LKAVIDPLRAYLNASEETNVDLLFLEGTLEGLTNQLMLNEGEMLQVANEAESFLAKLYSQKGKYSKLILDENKYRNMFLNFHGGGNFKCVTKTKGSTEIDNVALNFIGCIHPETIIKFLNRDDQNHDGLLERYKLKLLR